MDATVTVVGNLTADPELRYTATGAAVVNMTIASTPRMYDRQSGEWKDGEPLFLRGILWREYAINAAASLAKGMRVVAVGKLKQRNYETREGDRRTSVELEIDEIGPTLRYATAKCSRATQAGHGVSPDPWADSQGSQGIDSHTTRSEEITENAKNGEGAGKNELNKKVLVGDNVSYEDFDSDEVPF
ncbi:single-stranded DNA-binding protein [Tropheryma whipplei]|uniref:Single-stranded DNA-binding protein 1 n=1 Tax=Tropheryma whipplei (strain Twist) TaxID=203267 RepID=SSB1_TROWT|nr:single-stranded DNA-binding protein [Tropheryma whipplei]Q83N34.1 RecName: Full=Single-stranded DNA-binding protein 1; Short=SSB 1 [Tropheryma whipplei str. Twist]AAO44204.1 single-strand binding protein [Tropheryma whipplei str. Twist]MCO8190416.1 single-stranded DNA-binding protein [Tropheryma whipplei]